MAQARNFKASMWIGSCLAAVFVSAASMMGGQTAGYLHTSGSQILDSASRPVRLAGVNWYGFETPSQCVHGLSSQDYKTILNTVRSLGYNTVRIPFSNQMVESPIAPSDISYNNASGAINADLAGLNSLQILDRIVAYAGQVGLYVVLDDHRSEAGSSAEANGLWYTDQYPESAWIDDWVALANRYKTNPAVIGMDLRNEPHMAGSAGSCWGCGTVSSDWRLAAERGGNAVLAANPNLLIIVEGTNYTNGDDTWWGGNLESAAAYPVVLNAPNRLVYSAHDYGPDLWKQPWFNSSTTYDSLAAEWKKHWAYLSMNGVAPVWLGEFGTTNSANDVASTAAGSQGQYFESMIAFLAANPHIGWSYWALNGEDNFSLLDANYDATPVSAAKQSALASIQPGAGTAPVCSKVANTTTGLTATATSVSQINLAWTADAVPTGCNVTYNVYASTAANFVPSSASLLKSGATATSYSATGLTNSTAYYFAIEALDAAGASAPTPDVSAGTQSGAAFAPGSPMGLTAVATSATAVQLSWQASAAGTGTPGVTYNIYRGAATGFRTAQGIRVASGVSGTSYTNTGLTASMAYFYLVTAVSAGGESAASNQASATTLATAAAGAACHIAYTPVTQWNTGFQAGIEIDNTGSTALSSWTLTWTWPNGQLMTQAWNANLVQGGPGVALTSMSYNGAIAPGGSVTAIGFLGTYSGTNAAPTAFYLNGVLCR